MKENRVTLPQAIGFAITILILIISGVTQVNGRMSVLETKVQMHENGLKDVREMRETLIEIKVQQDNIIKKLDKAADTATSRDGNDN